MKLDPMREKLQIQEIATLLDYAKDYVSKLHAGVRKDLKETAGKLPELLPSLESRKDEVQTAARTNREAQGYGTRKLKR